MKRVLLLCILCVDAGIKLWAQLPNQVLYDPIKIHPSDSGKFGITLNNTNYMRNTEYFNPIEEGRTLFGYQLSPAFYYQPSSAVKIKAGAWFRHDFGGDNPFTEVIPVFSLKAIQNNHSIIFGSLEGSLMHGMPEPMMDINSVIEKRIENGFQYLYQSKVVKSDVWINWENYLKPGAFDKERFTAGLNTRIQLTNGNSGQFYFSLLGMASHQGGQIDTDTLDPFMMLFNPGISLAWEKKLSENFSYSADVFGLGYLETSNSGIYTETHGTGLLCDAGVRYKATHYMLSYWNGTNYIAPRGTAIYQSKSTVDPSLNQQNRSLLFFRIIHNKPLFKSPVMVSARFEPVYDLNNGIFDFSYSLYLVYNGSWKFTRNHR